MLKSSKLSHKSHKSSKDSSMRKSHLSKKSLRSRSPVRVPGSSRSPSSVKHMSSGMKRLAPRRKSPHSPRLRSITSSPQRSLSHHSKPESPVSMERERSMKALKYEKRKHMSPSPVRHMVPNSSRRPVSPHQPHPLHPYEMERYQSSGGMPHSPPYSSPTRKKVQREADRYFTSRSITPPSPPRRHPGGSFHPGSHIPPRQEVSPPPVHPRQRHAIPVSHEERGKHFEMRHKHHENPPMPASRLKESVKVPYAGESSRYRSPSPESRYSSGGSKPYSHTTLNERFSSVITTNRSEPRIHYSRADLEKITIDIRRNPRDSPPPPVRPIVNPSEVKLIRRANEGHRPIFDREEIKHVARGMREDPYYERKVNDSYNSPHPADLRPVENYQVTRRVDNHHEVIPGGGRALPDRYPGHSGRKEVMTLDRDEREKEYQRAPVSRSYPHSRSRSRSGDRDFRSERYLEAKPSSSSRPDYARIPIEPPEPRNNVPYSHRKNSIPIDARHKLNVKKFDRENHSSSALMGPKGHYPPERRHYPDSPTPPRGDRRDNSPVPELHKWDYKRRSPSREKFPEFSHRPDKYGYKPYMDKPNIPPPRSPDFYPESREMPGPYISRGGSRPFRSPRGFRTRGSFRGPMRGSSFHRGSFRGYRSSGSPRGRGIPRR